MAVGRLPRASSFSENHRAAGTGLASSSAVFVAEIFERKRDGGLLIRRGGLYGNVIRLTPPLTIDQAEVDHAIRILDRAFAKIQASGAV